MIILTDLSEVMVSGISGLEYRLADRHFTKPSDKADFAVHFMRRRTETNDQFMDLMRGRMNEDAFWHLFLAGGDWPVTLEEVKVAFAENLRDVVPGTLDVYRRITQHPDLPGQPHSCFVQGAPEIYLASDHIAERIPELRESHPDVFALLTDTYWSCEMDLVKGDPDFFPWVLRDLGLDPREALFVDDLHVNVAMAAHCGIPSILFRHANQLEATLREAYGVEFTPAGRLGSPVAPPPVPMKA